jgi:hypothetical protein
MSNGYRAGVREVRPGEDPPMCWDCIDCGIGEPCFCASPTRVQEGCPAVEVLVGWSDTGPMCTLPAGHEGDHEAWALPEGGTYDARAELLTTWPQGLRQ